MTDQDSYYQEFAAFFCKLAAKHPIDEARSLLQKWAENIPLTGDLRITARAGETRPPQPTLRTNAGTWDIARSSLHAPIATSAEPIQSRLTYYPEGWDYSQRTYSCPGKEWHDVVEYAKTLPPSLSGFTLSHVGRGEAVASVEHITRGSLRLQKPRLGRHGMLVVDEETRLLSEAGDRFRIPEFSAADVHYDPTELEQKFESLCNEVVSEDPSIYEYLTAMAHEPAVRRDVGLPNTGFYAGDRLLSSKKHFPGLHSSYFYMSKGTSFFQLHREDLYLKSANVLHKGAPKLWLDVRTADNHRLEARIAEALEMKGSLCDQFVRHRYLVIPPSKLREWNIKFDLVLQMPGDIKTVDGDTYHCGYNLGPNLAEAINYATADYDPPPLYRPCSQKSAWCPKTKPILPSDMERDKLRPLDVDTSWESVPPVKVTTQERTPRQSGRSTGYRIRKPEARTPRNVTRSKVATKQILGSDTRQRFGPLSRRGPGHEGSDGPPARHDESGVDFTRHETTESSLSHAVLSSGSSPLTSVRSSIEPSIPSTTASVGDADAGGNSHLGNTSGTAEGSESHSPILAGPEHRTSADIEAALSGTILATPDLQKTRAMDLEWATSPDLGADEQSDFDHFDDIVGSLNEETPVAAGTRADMQGLLNETPSQSSSTSSLIPTKRSSRFPNADINDSAHKKSRPVLDEVDMESEVEQRRRNLMDLGPQWIRFYDSRVSTGRFSAGRVYDILVLVSTIGSPSVLLDIAYLCQSKSMESLAINAPLTARAYHLYRAYEAKGITLQIQKSMISMFLYRQFEGFFEHHKSLHHIKSAYRSHAASQSTLSDNKNLITLALDELVASCLEISVEDLKNRPEQYKRDRRRIMRIKNDGRKMSIFNDRMKSELGILTLWTLLPMRFTKSTLDEKRNVALDHYYDLSDAEMEVFIMALRVLRPRLKSLCYLADEQQRIFSMVRESRPRLKLETVDPVNLLKEGLDSDLLLSCFESDDDHSASRSK